jgi:hypothetical protein
MKYKYTVLKLERSYTNEDKVEKHVCDSADAAFSWIDNNPIPANSWDKYIVVVTKVKPNEQP